MTSDILFKNWCIEKPICTIARQYDNLSRQLVVTGSLPEGYVWEMLIQCEDMSDIILLSPTETGAAADLNSRQLSVAGQYIMQLRGTRDDIVRHTNCIEVSIPSSLSGDIAWPEIPSAFSEMEKRLLELYAHPPRPSENGVWQMWDLVEHNYVDSEIPLPSFDAPEPPPSDGDDMEEDGLHGEDEEASEIPGEMLP